MQRDWEIIVNHRSDLLTQDLVLSGIYTYTDFTKLGFSFQYPYIQYNHINGDINWSLAQYTEMGTKLLTDEQYTNLIHEIETIFDRFKKFLKRFETELHTARQHPELIDEYFDEAMRATGSIARFVLESGLSAELTRQGIPPHAMRSAVTDTTRASVLLTELANRYRDELLDTEGKELHELSSSLTEDLQTFCKKYGYLGMKYFKGHPWTVIEAYVMLRDSLHHAPEEQKEMEAVDSPFVRYAEQLLRLRTEKWEANCYGTYLFREMVMICFADIVQYDELLHMRIEEVKNVLHGRMYIKPKFDTRNNFILEITDSAVELFEGKEEQVKSTEERPTEITGMCAQPGKVVGKVKVVLHAKECAKIEQGDILVAAMSTPDFLTGMRRAAAFVTDIGGITSHAAIVAREMNKPCVIGTKIGTKVLKDGDLVEVDAHIGKITILTKN